MTGVLVVRVQASLPLASKKWTLEPDTEELDGRHEASYQAFRGPSEARAPSEAKLQTLPSTTRTPVAAAPLERSRK